METKNIATKRQDPLGHMMKSVFKDVTPVRLRLLLIVNLSGALVFLAASVMTVRMHEHAVRTVGFDAAPSVIAAHQIKVAVEQMDNDLANELIAVPRKSDRQLFADDFDKSRITVCRQLVAAARNITYGKAEQEPIENLQIGLGKFEMQAQTALVLQDDGKSEAAIQAYRASLQTLTDKLLPNADLLNQANADALEATYSQEESDASLSSGFVLAAGILLSVSLGLTQVYLFKRFRRRLNLPLFFAMAATLAFVAHLYPALTKNGNDLKIAKEDAYNSIVALLDAKANAYNANAAQARWLLDRQHQNEHEKTFSDATYAIAHFESGHDFAETIIRAEKLMKDSEKLSLPGFNGLLADELSNIRFVGEGRSALETLKAFSNYWAIDRKMRELEKSGDHDGAVRLGLGYTPDAAKYSFTRFDDAIEQTLEINREHFDLAIKDALADMNGLAVMSQLLSALVALCIYFGMRPRMAEYVR